MSNLYSWGDNPTASGAVVDVDQLNADLMHLKYDVGRTWKPSTAYTQGDVIRPSVYNKFQYECTTAGTSDAAEPTWATTAGLTTTDGTAVWTCRGLASGGGAVGGFGNYIVEPFNVLPGTGLQALIEPNTCIIDNTECKSLSQTPITLTAKAAQLIYKKKDNTYDKLLPKMTATDLVDANTVGLWFPDGSASVPNAAVGVNGNTLAVANALTKSGTITAVDGWAGGDAAKGNGSTGVYTSANSTGFPTGNANVNITALITFNGASAQGAFAYTGNTYVGTTAAGNLMIFNAVGAALDTGYSLTVGSVYALDFVTSEATTYIFVNGQLCATTAAYNGTVSQLTIFSGVSQFSSPTVHFVRLRNTASTPAQIATVAQEMLIPCAGPSDILLSPLLTSNSAPSPYATSADTEYSAGAAAYKGSGSNTTFWATTVSAVPHWWKIDYGAIQEGVGAYSFVQNNTDLGWSGRATAWRLEGSNTGAFAGEESIIDSRSGFDAASGVETIFTLSSKVSYRYFRLYVTASTGDGSVAMRKFTLRTPTQSDIRSVLPADSMSVAYVETGETAPTLIVDGSNPSGATPDWAYGIRVGPKGLDNKIKFLGWQYFSGSGSKTWDNPFDDKSVKLSFMYSDDASGTNKSTFTFGDMVYQNSGLRIDNIKSNKFRALVASTQVNGAWKTSGYVGVYAQVIG